MSETKAAVVSSSSSSSSPPAVPAAGAAATGTVSRTTAFLAAAKARSPAAVEAAVSALTLSQAEKEFPGMMDCVYYKAARKLVAGVDKTDVRKCVRCELYSELCCPAKNHHGGGGGGDQYVCPPCYFKAGMSTDRRFRIIENHQCTLCAVGGHGGAHHESMCPLLYKVYVPVWRAFEACEKAKPLYPEDLPSRLALLTSAVSHQRIDFCTWCNAKHGELDTTDIHFVAWRRPQHKVEIKACYECEKRLCSKCTQFVDCSVCRASFCSDCIVSWDDDKNACYHCRGGAPHGSWRRRTRLMRRRVKLMAKATGRDKEQKVAVEETKEAAQSKPPRSTKRKRNEGGASPAAAAAAAEDEEETARPTKKARVEVATAAPAAPAVARQFHRAGRGTTTRRAQP